MRRRCCCGPKCVVRFRVTGVCAGFDGIVAAGATVTLRSGDGGPAIASGTVGLDGIVEIGVPSAGTFWVDVSKPGGVFNDYGKSHSLPWCVGDTDGDGNQLLNPNFLIPNNSLKSSYCCAGSVGRVLPKTLYLTDATGTYASRVKSVDAQCQIYWCVLAEVPNLVGCSGSPWSAGPGLVEVTYTLSTGGAGGLYPVTCGRSFRYTNAAGGGYVNVGCDTPSFSGCPPDGILGVSAAATYNGPPDSFYAEFDLGPLLHDPIGGGVVVSA